MLALERTTSAFNRFGISRSYGYQLVRRGLFPPPISADEKPSRVLSKETDTVIAAKAAGATNDQIKKLVAQMMLSRKAAWDGDS